MTKNKPLHNIGIFGGTFNPVHNAHVAVAEKFISEISLDLLYVIPNNIPPMKESYGVDGEARLEMLKIAFSGKDKVKVSDIELSRPGMSYTRDTVAALKEIHPKSELYLLIGDDWVEKFHLWRDSGYILDNVNLVVACRMDRDISDALKRLEKLSGRMPVLLKNERITVSSSEIRNDLQKEKLPEGVYEYSQKRGLYKK